MATAQILFVCTANICRSPLAEHLARSIAPAGGPLTFASAGFLYDDERCPEPLTELLGRQGTDISAHRSRILDAELLRQADLVVTMEAAHVRQITVSFPWAFAKTVPLVELARLLSAGPRPLDAVLAELAQRDPSHFLSVGTRDDVPDPYRRGDRAYAEAVERIDELVRTVINGLLSQPSPSPAPAPLAPPATPPPRSRPVSPLVIALVLAVGIAAAGLLLTSL